MRKLLWIVCFATFVACAPEEDSFLDSGVGSQPFTVFNSFQEYEEFLTAGTPLSEGEVKGNEANFRSFSSSSERQFESPFFDVLNEDGIIQIGDFIFKIDMNEGYVAYVKANDNIDLLSDRIYESGKVNLFSVYDDVIDLLGQGISHTIEDLDELEEYNSRIVEAFQFANSEKATESKRVLSNNLFISDPYANPSFYHSAPYDFGINCNFNWGNSFPSGLSANHHRIIDLKRCPGSGGKDWQAEVDLRYIASGVYFELRSELTYSSNPVMSTSKTSVNNNHLELSNYYHYERRRRFQRNLIVEDTRTLGASNASYLRNIVYSGSRSLVWFVLKPTFSYDDMSNSDPACSGCNPFERRTVAVL